MWKPTRFSDASPVLKNVCPPKFSFLRFLSHKESVHPSLERWNPSLLVHKSKTVFTWYQIEFYSAYNVIPVPYWVSIFVCCMIPIKISFLSESFQKKLIPVAAPDQNFRSRTKPGRKFHRYLVHERQAHSSTDITIRHVDWLSWSVDSCSFICSLCLCFYRTFISEWELLCKRGMNYVCRTGMKFILVSCKHRLILLC